jgi:hypothetical protein
MKTEANSRPRLGPGARVQAHRRPAQARGEATRRLERDRSGSPTGGATDRWRASSGATRWPVVAIVPGRRDTLTRREELHQFF